MPDKFIASLREVPWLANAGKPCEVRCVSSIQSVFDVEPHYEVWSRQTYALEEVAQKRLGDAAIDEVFSAVGRAINPRVLAAIGEFLERRYTDDDIQKSVDSGLCPEVVESIGRDVAWAAIEASLEQPAFFSEILLWYLKGRWPCSWDGEYPEGSVAVL